MARTKTQGEEMTMNDTHDVKERSVWQHRNGAKYRVKEFTNLGTNDHEKYPITVVYENVDNGTVWSRPLHDWHRSMTWLYDFPEGVGHA